jgi:hypothetical protein
VAGDHQLLGPALQALCDVQAVLDLCVALFYSQMAFSQQLSSQQAS